VGGVAVKAMTVAGPLEATALGATAVHEHVLCSLHLTHRHVLDETDVGIHEMQLFREAGGNTLVDTTCIGIGRDAPGLLEISKGAEVNIVTATGFYRDLYYPDIVSAMTSVELADLFIRELTEGIDGTGIRAGIIGELGTNHHHITPAEERVFRAGIIAHKETGAPITTHTFAGELALAQIRLLLSEDVNPQRLIIGHMGDRRDLDHQIRILEYGVYIAYDHVGITELQLDEVRAEMISQLIDRGYGDQILISCDIAAKTRLRWYGGLGYGQLFNTFIPLLKEKGVHDSDVKRITVDNPARVLGYLS
jgi:predicted metal-dependent phosphotriesterase family hydrolase